MSHYQSLDPQEHDPCNADHCTNEHHPNQSINQSFDQSLPHRSFDRSIDDSTSECANQSNLGDVIPVGHEALVTHGEPEGVNMLHESFAGSVAGCVARFVIAPLDVIKIRFQIQETPHQSTNQPIRKPQYQSVIQAFRTIAHEEGVRAFWKGNLAAQLMIVPYSAVSFLAYQKCKYVMEKFVVKNADIVVPDSQSTSSANPSITHRNHHLVNICSGSFAGFCATLVTYPLDLMRTRFAAQQEPKLYTSLGSAAISVVSKEGIRGLYSGMWPTLCGIVPLMALQFGCYEGMKTAIETMRAKQCMDEHEKRELENDESDVQSRSSSGPPSTSHNSIKVWEQTICGFTAGVASKFLTMPFDVIKKRFQVGGFAWDATTRNHQSSQPDHLPNTLSHSSVSSINPSTGRLFVAGHRPFTGVVDCFRGIVRHEGWRGLFKGTVPSTLKAGPNSAIIYVVYEQTMNLLQGREKKKKEKRQQINKSQH